MSDELAAIICFVRPRMLFIQVATGNQRWCHMKHQSMSLCLMISSQTLERKVQNCICLNRWSTILLSFFKYNSNFAKNISSVTCAERAAAHEIFVQVAVHQESFFLADPKVL